MVSGSMNGKTGSFTMTMPMGSMMSTGGGPFDHGQMSMVHARTFSSVSVIGNALRLRRAQL